jgi:hypothetical protein
VLGALHNLSIDPQQIGSLQSLNEGENRERKKLDLFTVGECAIGTLEEEEDIDSDPNECSMGAILLN